MGNIRKEELYQASAVLKVVFVLSQAFFICRCDAELWIHFIKVLFGADFLKDDGVASRYSDI